MRSVINITCLAISVVFLIVGTPIALVYKVLTCIFKRKYNREWFMKTSIAIDRLGNVIGDDFFNGLLIKKTSDMRFGASEETISSVIGKNYVANKLTPLGMGLRNILNFIDEDHSIESIGK